MKEENFFVNSNNVAVCYGVLYFASCCCLTFQRRRLFLYCSGNLIIYLYLCSKKGIHYPYPAEVLVKACGLNLQYLAYGIRFINNKQCRMQGDDIIEVARPNLNDLDTALQELGMLATTTNSRREYMNENYVLNMLTINTRYVTNVSVGFRVKPTVPHNRYKPYKTPKERHRTRSENNDVNEVSVSSVAKTLVDECIDDSLEEITQLKKAKSLESIIAENSQIESISLQNINLGLRKNMELEQVSNSIQNLKVVE